MRRGRVLRTICLLGLGCLAVFVLFSAWRYAQSRARARELSDEVRRAADAYHEIGVGGAGYVTVQAPWGVFNQISYNFRDVKVTDEQLWHFAGLTGVVGLDFSENPITDEGLRYIGQIPHLQWLQLSGTKITDRGIRHLRNLRYLHSLDLTSTNTTQEAAKDLAGMARLEIVYARGTGLREVPDVTVNTADEPDTWIRDCIERSWKQD